MCVFGCVDVCVWVCECVDVRVCGWVGGCALLTVCSFIGHKSANGFVL